MFVRNIFHQVQKTGVKDKLLGKFLGMILFFVLADGLLSFLTPLLIVKAGISESMMGLIIGTSSLFGAIFDFLICIMMRNSNYRRIFILMFILAMGYPFLIWGASSAAIFILAMAVWGLYYDFYGIGTLSFVGNNIAENDHGSSFAKIRAFHSLGYVLAPMIAGLFVARMIDDALIILALISFFVAFIFFRLVIVSSGRKDRRGRDVNLKRNVEKDTESSVFSKSVRWFSTIRLLLPLVLSTIILNVFDSTFWVVGPLISADSGKFFNLGSLLILMYQVPPLVVGVFLSSIISKRKGMILPSMLIMLGGIVFISLPFLPGSIMVLSASLLGSFFLAVSWPMISASYARKICELPEREGDIESVQDYSTNLGYVIGPILAGYFSQKVGHIGAFSLVGVIGIIVSLSVVSIYLKSKISNKRD